MMMIIWRRKQFYFFLSRHQPSLILLIRLQLRICQYCTNNYCICKYTHCAWILLLCKEPAINPQNRDDLQSIFISTKSITLLSPQQLIHRPTNEPTLFSALSHRSRPSNYLLMMMPWNLESAVDPFDCNQSTSNRSMWSPHSHSPPHPPAQLTRWIVSSSGFPQSEAFNRLNRMVCLLHLCSRYGFSSVQSVIDSTATACAALLLRFRSVRQL